MHPVLFTFQNFTVYTYGFFAALAMLTVFLVAGRMADSKRLPRDIAYDLLFLLFLTGVIGARLFFVLQHLSDFSAVPLQIFSIREGGLVWYGGFITAASAGLYYAWKKDWPVLNLCDFFSPLVALGHGIGRIGCFMNGCCYGREAGAWGVVFPGDSVSRLPVQLYEAGGLFFLAAVTAWFYSQKRRDGEVFIAYLAGYGILRFGLEFLRADQILYAGLTLPQWTSLLLIMGAIFIYFSIRKVVPPAR
jgi:phosphatidylglycerol---prolipoprotein diacylglyceryl transferase